MPSFVSSIEIAWHQCKLPVWHYTLPACRSPYSSHTHRTHTPRWTHQSLSICQQMTCIDAGDESLKEFGVQCGCVRCFRGVWQRGCLKVCNTWRALHDADVPMSQLFRQTPLTRLPPSLMAWLMKQSSMGKSKREGQVEVALEVKRYYV